VADYKIGVAALKAGKYKEADNAFDAVLDATPRDVNVLIMSGLAKEGRNNLKGAQRAFERAVKADGKSIDAHRELALVYAKQGDAAKAKTELSAIQSRSDACGITCPDAAALKAATAAVEGALANPKPSARNETRSGLLFTDASTGDQSYFKAVSLINEGRYEDALVALNVAKNAFGPHPDVLTYMGYTYRKLAQYDQAETYYKEALKVAPDHKAATEYYGELKVERGDMAGARVLLARLETLCTFSCAEEQELRRWVDAGRRP
jgi:tetratricopeptide (TPR) repeat protein